jgi:hypothetical protein
MVPMQRPITDPGYLSLMRPRTWALAALALVVACGPEPAKSSADTKPWYHESDVSRLSATGRPQLVEFFHPG